MGINKTNNLSKTVLFTKDESFSSHTTMGVGGKIKYFCQPKTLKQFIDVISFSNTSKIPYFILGNGSNILASDKFYNGIVISTKKLNKIIFLNDTTVRAYCGANLSELIDYANKHSLGGMEALFGIPATVGGAVVMNAGAFSVNISHFIDRVCVLENGQKKIYEKEDCLFAYRNSIFKVLKLPILYVDFSFFNVNIVNARKNIDEYIKLRKEKQPYGKNCGSVFKNPLGYTAGKIIESVALKGKAIGGATISSKHANFIINEKNASFNDVKDLINLIKKKVKEIYNIELQEEVEYVGK